MTQAPNFLVIGPRKAGTTSIYFYLRQHPQIFMSPVKELTFFANGGKQLQGCGPQFPQPPTLSDLPVRGLKIPDAEFDAWWSADISSWEEYLECFSGVTTEVAIGEVTPGNLFSKVACENIHHFLPNIRLICILRQPVDRGFSQFQHTRRMGLEPVSDFVSAYQNCEHRRQANWHPFLSEYETRGYYVKSLQSYFNCFSKEQIGIYLYDDLCSKPVAMMQEMYKFLNVDSSFVPDVSHKYNRSQLPKNYHLNRIVRQESLLKRILKRMLPTKLRRIMVALNHSHPRLDPIIRRELSAEYTGEIKELQELIGRDLSRWLEDES